MAEDNPNLIPPPSIGESKPTAEQAVVAKPKKSKLWMVVLLCVVAGIGMGVFVYQQSIAPVSTPAPSKKPVATPKPSVVGSPSPVGSAAPAGINAVTPMSNTVVFPKAGEVRVYFGAYTANPTVSGQLIRLTTPTGEADVTMPATVPAGDKMAYRDSGLEVSAGQSVTIASFDRGNTSQPSYGWMAPNTANKCATDYSLDVAPMVTWATQKSAGEPLVSVQCWADWNQPNDPTPRTYNDFLIALSYTPASQTTTSPSPSVSPSPSASARASATPSPSPSVLVSQASISPSPSARVTVPEASSLPTAGVFEVTAGTVGIGVGLIILGILGLLLI